MRTSRGTGAWSWAGIVAGFAGLATSYALAMALTIRESPVVAVAELVIKLTPGRVVEEAIARLGFWDKPLLLGGILLFLTLLFAYAGRLAARGPWQPLAVWLPLAAVGTVAVVVQRGQTLVDYLPLALGLATWVVVLRLLASVLLREQEAAAGPDTRATVPDEAAPVARGDRPDAASSRRAFLLASGAVALVAAATTGLGRVVGAGRRGVEASRRLLKIEGVTEPSVPARARIGLDGVSPWMTPNEDFYLIHTAIVVPTIAPGDWSVRIHGMVEREVVLTYAELLERERTEAWVTLNCVSNPVGGNLIGNAWWSGVRLDALLAEAGPLRGADAVKQTSHDGWTCGTPLAALTDGRDAMLAVAMNGKPLPIEHGFPVRTIVPGLYGFVSACKWVVDIEVTRFADFTAYWTGKGWSAQAPVKIASRIDVPRQGQDVGAGKVQVGGVAWHQRTGIDAVEVSLDGGGWQRAALASVPTDDTWVQWALTLDDVPPGDHQVRVRAIGKDGDVQTGVERDVVPDGATGWHGVEFTARA